MARECAKLLLIPENGGRLRQLRIPLVSLYAVLGLCVLTALFIFGAGFVYLANLRSERAAEVLSLENEALRSELVAMGAVVDRLQTQVHSHIKLANDSRLLAGLAPISAEVAQLGVGGTPTLGPNPTCEGLPGSLDRTVGLYHERLEQLSRQLHFQEESFVEVRQVIESNRDRLNHIPTVHPVLGDHYTSSGFGRRRDPFTGQPDFHPGIDFCAARGTPFRATADGEVVYAAKNGGMGKTIKIDHGNGYLTLYGHCDEVLVKKGQAVRRGDIIGKIGNTGRSTGPHLHYEIRQGDRAINPRSYILDTHFRGR